MRDKSFYKEKAEAIKNDVLEIQKKGEIFNISLSNLRFKSAAVGGRIDFVQKDFDKVISKIDFFIHYLDTYVD